MNKKTVHPYLYVQKNARMEESMREIRKITSKKEIWDEEMFRDTEQKIKAFFKDTAYLYLELDDKVLLGLYEGHRFCFYGDVFEDEKKLVSYEKKVTGTVAVSKEWSSESLGEIWDWVQRFILFNGEQELRLYRNGDCFHGRLRRDIPCDDMIFVTDEEQKIWGSIVQVEENWNQVQSLRGSSIWVPSVSGNRDGKKRIGKSVGVQVRSYFDFPDAAEGRGLVIQADERMMGICPWPGEEGSV